METSKVSNTRLALTFDDVLVLPRYSEILPRNVSTQTKITRGVVIETPLLSSAMDTVTESKMAIAMAMNGGIGIIHKNLSMIDQAKMVRSVKLKNTTGIISRPLKCKTTDLISEIKHKMEEREVHHFAVVDEDDLFVGMVSYKDLDFYENRSKALIKKVVKKCKTTTENLSYNEAKIQLRKSKSSWLPVISSLGKISGLYTWKDTKIIEEYPNASRDEKGRLLCGAAVGIDSNTMDRVTRLVNANVDVIVLDTAHGHTKGVYDKIREIKLSFPDLEIIAGNVATREAALFLVEAGADAVKVGIGPGSICTTRIIAGIGVPQITAIMEVASALQGTGVPVIADGGIRHSGDIVKAIVAGADTVMIGSKFAGTEESPGETEIQNGQKVKMYRGMGSIEAMKDGSADRYSQDPEAEFTKLVPEGIVSSVPFRGSVEDIIYQLVGGIRAGMGYTGSCTIQDLQTAEFVQITNAGLRESHTHDVSMTKEAPNYTKNN